MLYFYFRVFEIFFNTKQGLGIMLRLNLQERTKIIEFWHKVKSVKQVQRLHCGHFGVHMRDAPNFRTISPLLQSLPMKEQFVTFTRVVVVGRDLVAGKIQWIW